jgi:hypothetical protein
MTDVKPDPIVQDIVRSIAFVQSAIGQIHSEAFITKALCEELKELDFEVEQESPIPSWFTTSTGKRRLLGILKADVIATRNKDTILIEIKALNPTPANKEAADRQIRCYLRFSDRVFAGAYAVFFPRKDGEAPSMFRSTAL